MPIGDGDDRYGSIRREVNHAGRDIFDDAGSHHRFEGPSDPDDMSVVYGIEATMERAGFSRTLPIPASANS